MRSGSVTAVLAAVFFSVLVSVGSAATPEQIEQRALEAMGTGEYAKAVDLWQELLERNPDQPRILYNLACCYSRMGEVDLATLRLEQAYEAGFTDLEFLNSDADLEALRESRKGRALIERLSADKEQIRRLRGDPGYFDAPVLGGYRVVVPSDMKKDRAYPLVVILHGHGANPENYVGIFERVASSLDAVIFAPYGPYPIPLESGHGYSWYPAPWYFREVLRTSAATADRTRRREEIELREKAVSQAFVMAAIEHVSAEYPVDPERVFLMGHSEGGVLAYGLALERPDVFRGLIVVGSRLRASDATTEILAAASGDLEVMICHSRDDAAIAFDHAKAAHETLKEAGIQSKIYSYAGGHGITAELAQAIARWIAARCGE